MDAWLKVVLDHLGVQSPDGEVWSGHSLRIGAASAMDAEGVTLRRICWMGGWAAQSAGAAERIKQQPSARRACRRVALQLLAAHGAPL